MIVAHAVNASTPAAAMSPFNMKRLLERVTWEVLQVPNDLRTL
jgi:hypothetical protein